MKSSSQIPREASSLVVHRVQVDIASAVVAQVCILLGAVEALNPKGSIVYRCTRAIVSLGEVGRSRNMQYVPLKMVPKAGEAVLLVRASSMQEP